ncbi:MAG: hypothetical protein LBN12_02870 [Clostridiales Family XIII bacterium]|jgi:hypothetical protein|nr:hypothetical protein [Clostridiales Family XIII bacterium]
MYNNNFQRRTAALFVTLFTALSTVLISPPPALAGETGLAPAKESGQITMEYRYAAGEEVSIPDTIMQFGSEYRLIHKSDPIEEGSLPETRTYTYRISGLLTEEQIEELRDADDIKITPVKGSLKSQVERDVILKNRPTNDIEDLPQVLYGMKLAEASFAVAGKDGYGIPNKYTATTVYRGSETTEYIAYYAGEATYTRTVTEDGTLTYVVVATYALSGAVPIQEPAPPEGNPIPIEDPAGEVVMTDIPDNPNPLTAFWDSRSVTEKIGLLACFAVILLASLFLLFGIRRKQYPKTSRKTVIPA